MTKNCYKLLRKIASFSLNNPYSYNATETFKYTNEPKNYTQPTYTKPKYNATAQNTFDPGRYMPSTSSTINFGAVGGDSEENKTYSKYQKQFGRWLGSKLFGKKTTGTPVQQSAQAQPELLHPTPVVTQSELAAQRHDEQKKIEDRTAFGMYRAAPSKAEQAKFRADLIARWRAKPAAQRAPHQQKAIEEYDAANGVK